MESLALLLEWRETPEGWQGRVVRPVLDVEDGKWRPREEVVPPTVEEVASVADVIGDRWRAVVVTLAGSGLRIAELLGLEVSDVDFLRRTIRVERQRTQAGRITPTKGRRSRTVPVGQVVIDELAAHLAAYPSDGALFTDEIGEPLPYWRWKRLLAAATSETGVDVTAHGFRHFAASALISGGASVKQVQAFLGHASAVITLRTYAHMWPGDEDRTPERAGRRSQSACGLAAD